MCEGRLPAARRVGTFPQFLEPPHGGWASWVTNCPWPLYPHIEATSWGPVTLELLTTHASVLRKYQVMWTSPGFTVTFHGAGVEMFDKL